MKITELPDSDLKEALALVWTVFCEFEAPEYKPEGIEVFRQFISYDSIITMQASGMLRIWGSYKGDVLTGVIAARGTSHISLLFVRREYQRKGIARALFNAVEECCRNAKISAITVNSSPYAVDAYRHLGFIDTDRETGINGIRFTPMKYKIQYF